MVGLLAIVGVASADDGALYRALRVRDGVSCLSLGEPTPALRDGLMALTDPAVEPSAVPVRAAGCLVALFPSDPTVDEAVVAWVSDPERRGLALVVAGNVDVLPADVAVRVARAAAAVDDPRWRDRFAKRLQTSANADVRAAVARP